MKVFLRISGLQTMCVLAVLLTACSKSDKVPSTKQDGFEWGSFEEAGISKQDIIRLENEITSGSYNIHSILILRNDKLIYEKYFQGEDAVFPNPAGVMDHNRETLHDCRSLTKSIVSACVGIALEQGKIHSLDDKIFDYFPGYSTYAIGDRAKITIKDLLTMSAGFEWDETTPYIDTLNSEINMSIKPDIIGFILSRPMVHSPGTLWNYSGGCTQLLAEIVKNATGTRIDRFARAFLFNPLKIDNYDWFVRKPLTPTDTATVWAPSGLRMRPIDMAKIGSLYLNGGMYDKKKIFSGSWVKQSLHWQINTDGSNEGYGFQFWCTKPMIAGEYRDVIMADGNGGQRICMIPSLGVEIVLTAGNYDESGSLSDELLNNVFFPAIQ
ncbi:MAG: serine hydrolase domain-containing protein [Niastella sp.]|uniref:serine hydrolase domain-containing protein n=1 Tax=Niastella sp. TaxID=1869183 RepID=UPI00389A41C3